MTSVRLWTVAHVVEWLDAHGMFQYIPTFEKNKVDGKTLLTLTKQDLKDELDIEKLSDRKQLWAALEALLLEEKATALTPTSTSSPSASPSSTSTSNPARSTTNSTYLNVESTAASSSSGAGGGGGGGSVVPPPSPTVLNRKSQLTSSTQPLRSPAHGTDRSVTPSRSRPGAGEEGRGGGGGGTSGTSPRTTLTSLLPLSSSTATSSTAGVGTLKTDEVLKEIKRETEALTELMHEVERIQVEPITYSPVRSSPSEHPFLPPHQVPGYISPSMVTSHALSTAAAKQKESSPPPSGSGSGVVGRTTSPNRRFSADDAKKVNYQQLILEQQQAEARLAALKEHHDAMMKSAGFK